ncbi:dynein heavy chain domain-containing protein 1-like [Porites lutea]|uniref:dynein heavy chain domain-containing protein 1-like n=1 Tax=Porites lutea TaxID=51062 RepID=UPI003CC624D9
MSNQAAEIEMALSQPKLPAIGDSRNLVSQPLSTAHEDLNNGINRERSFELRSKSSGELENEDVKLLFQLVSRRFVNALQQNTKQSWLDLCQVLDVVKPYAHFLAGSPQIVHYVERACQKIQESQDEGESTFLLEKLCAVFPAEFSLVQDGARPKNVQFPAGSSEESLFTPRGQHAPLSKGVRIPCGEPLFPGGTTYTFDKTDGDMTSYGPKPLCLEDLKRSLPSVVREIAFREATLKGSLGTTALALDTDLPQTRVPTPPLTPRRSPSVPIIKTPISEAGCISQLSESKKSNLPKTGREVVECYVKGRFLGEVKFAFLNIAPSVRYDPYNLVVVPENKVKPEHYVISSYCILHVNPFGPSESQSLAEWYREACLFKAISSIGFFKNYLTTKMFRKWKDIKKLSHFLKVESAVERSLISNVPSFGSALLRISSLLQDLEKITFLPFQVNFSYSLEEFEDTVFRTCNKGYQYMEKFFNYCQMIVDKTQESCFEYLEYCEGQVKNHRHNYHESLAVGKRKRAIRQQNLKLARDEVRRLGTFVSLVDHIIVSNLLTLTQGNISRFVNETMPGPRPEREGLFSAEIVFGDDHKLMLSPSVKQFAHAVDFAVRSVISASCNLSHAMELGQRAQAFQEKAEKNGAEEGSSEDDSAKLNGSVTVESVYTKEKKEDGDIENLIYGKDSKIVLTGQQPVSHATTTIMTHFVEEPDTSHSDSSITRTDGEINEDLDGLNSDLLSARDMKEVSGQELCLHQDHSGGLLVEGQRFQDFAIDRSPLTKEKMMHIMYKNQQIKQGLMYQTHLLAEASKEVELFCDDHTWIAEIHEFVTSWGDGQVENWRGQLAIKIEQQLNKIKAWKEKVLSMTKSFCTENGIFFVDCHDVQQKLLPQLNSIYKKMVQMVALDVIRLSDEMVKDVDELSQLLADPKTDIKGFADFMQKLSIVKEHVPRLKEKVEYIKNLYEVIRSCYRQLTPEEEVSEEKVWATWEGFLFSLQEASDFVEMHKPQVSEKLLETISALEQSAEEIEKTATSGRFLDPNENPKSIVQSIRELRDKFIDICNKLSDLSKCQAVILGEEYNLKHVTDILEAIDKRQELWRYCDASSHAIREWLQTVFKKMNVKKAMDKLTEWNNAGEKLKQHVPNNDEVLHSWLSQLEEFAQDLPLLLQLSSDALKSRHWRALFIGMGQDYDPTWDFTVADLLSFHLGRYKDLISAICAGAAAEYALELQLNQLARGWEEKDFKLAKHIPLMRPRMEGDQRKSAKGKRKTKKTGHGTEKKNVKVKPKTPASVPDVFILIGVGDLKCVIEDNMVTLHMMLTSPHVVDLKPMVETWITNLQEIENIIDIWADCQKKWLYLSNVFAEPEIRKALEESNRRYLEVDEKYREYVQVILKDPKVMSVLPLKKRGQKGWRELQGDVLRELLLGLIRKEEELIRLVEKYIEKTRVEFPRLFFLSDNDLLGLLAWSRNPKDLLPFVRKCFPGIKNLQFTLPRDGNLKLASSLDTALNAHLLQVTALQGMFEEVLPLISVIPASPRPQGWLATLEERMRNTLIKSLAECVLRRLSGKENPSDLLELMTTEGTYIAYQDHTLLKFPNQCILTTEAIMWSKDMSEALQNGSLRGLSDLKKSLAGFMVDLSGAIRKNMECNDTSAINNRLELLLAALAAMTIHQRDTVTDFMKQGITDVNSFEWASQLQHQIEIKPVLSSSYQGENNDSSCTSKTIPINRLYEVGRCSVRQLGTSFVYGYEYLGPTHRLVVTPLTQRCFLTLTMALRSHQCGVPVGPDGIGKTETVKDLSKAFARHLVMFNCSEQLTNSMLVRFLYGMVRSGSWACFENVDCLGAGILSCLGQHLSTIRTSLKCLEKLVTTQYTARGFHKPGTQEADNVKRRSSITTLHFLPNETFIPGSKPDSLLGNHLAKGRRHHVVLEGGDLQEADYYSDAPRVSSLEEQSKLQETFQDRVEIEHKKELRCKEFKIPLLGNIVFEGQLMPASEMYGCFMTMSKSYSLTADLPENFRAQLRPVSMVFPDCRPVVEVWLVGCGFTEAKPLSIKMDTFFKLINQQVSCQPQYSFGLRSMKMVTLLAGKQLQRDVAKKRPNTMGSFREESSSDLKGDTALERKTKSPFLETLERRQSEENAVVHSLFTYFGNKLLLEDKELFSRAVDEVFAHSVLMSVSTEGDPLLVEQVKEHLQANGLQVRQEVISKILQLYTSLQTSRSVILLGCPGSGKSTIYSTLASALNTLNGKATQAVVTTRRHTVGGRKISNALKQAKAPVEEIKDVLWPRVDLSVVFPKSLTCEELFGRQLPDNNVWVDGVVSKWLRDSTLTHDTMAELLTSQFSDKQRIARMMGSLSHVKKWLVLDGPMDDTWLENMGTLLDSTRALNLASGETISQPETVTLLFEVTELSHVSPALVTRCGLIHCPETTVGWKSMFRSWMKGAHAKWDITNRGLGIISCLMDHTVDSTLKFLSNNCQSVLTEGYGSVRKPSKTAAGIYEVQTLLRYLSAIFDRHILREDDDSTIHMMQRQRQSVSSTSSRQSSGIPASDTGKVTSSFAFAFVWAFGGHLHERYAPKFNEHARQLLSSGPYPVLVPPDGSVYDYCLDFIKGALVKWDERPGAQFKTLPSSYTVVSELDRYFYLMDLMVSSSQPVLLVGSTGSGKTSLMQNLIYPRHNFTRICLSPGLTSKLLQEAIEHKLQLIQRKEMNQMALQKSLAANAPTSKSLPGVKSRTQPLFLDDLNSADVDEFGIQPPLELLRQILSQGTLYNKQRHHSSRVQHLKVMAACVPPGAAASCGGVASYPLSHRLSRLMTVLSFFSLSSESLQSIYSAVFLAWLEEFPAYSLTHHEQLAKALSSATIKMYSVIQQELLPTPLHPHFLFTQHELSRVVQGMTSLYSKTRGRPRPRARRRTEGGGEVDQESKGAAIPAANSDQSFRNKENGQRGGYVGKGRSWPSLTSGPRETALSANTPAVLSPMIRSLLRLWCHESTRTYSDRLLTEQQRHWFSSLLHETVEEFFCRDNSEVNSEMFSVEQAEIQQVLEGVAALATFVSSTLWVVSFVIHAGIFPQSIEAVKAKGAALVDSLFTYSDLWHNRRSSAQQRLLTAPGDALVTAAAVCYLGPLAPAAREHLFSDWLQVCDGTFRDTKERLLSLSSMVLDDARNKASVDDNCTGRESRPTTQSTLASTLATGNLPLRKDVSLQTILSSPNEVDEWRRNDLPTDEHALQNVLILRSCGDDRSRAWPLLIDPHNQAELWIRALHEDDALGNQSRPGTRLSDRSSTRQSRRSSIESDPAALDYTHLEQSGADEYEDDAQFSDNEVDQFLQSLKESGDQDSIFQESEAAVTSRTERTAGSGLNSGLTMTSERMLTDKLAETMGIQMENSPQPVPSGPTPVLNLSGGDILIVPVDDPELIEKLRAAVRRGLVTLVTHVERRRWSKSLELLLMRQTFTNTEGVLQVIIGKTAVDYNPSFRLYLSSSQPLFMTGEGLYPLPFSKVCTISMAVSREGICDMLLADTLRLERPEFEGQLRSVERDVGLHKQQIFHAKEFILERVLNLGGPLLKDSAMLESVMQSKEDICMAEEGCHEAEKMKRELLAKQDDFLSVAQHGALLFVVLSELHKLHPYYRYPLESFLKLFHVTIAERNRGKKSSGSPAARAAELITALSRKVFDRTSWSLFQADNHLFPFLLAVEKMMNKGIVTREEWQIFTRMSIEAQVDSNASNIDSSAANTDQYGYDNIQKPPWVSDQAWDCIDELEVLPAFSGLKQSVAKHSEQWREYFNLPPVLLGITPGGYAHLTVFQKALLWKTVQPNQLFHVCQDIVLYQMGAAMTQSVGYDLQLVYPVTSRSRPVLFLLPSLRILSQGESNVFKDPVTDVINLARSHNKIESLVKVTFGETDDMDRALAAVTQGMITGCWVILENCHLAARWSEEFFHQLETIVNMREIITENETERQFTRSSSEEKSEMTAEVETMLVHPDFRLWLTTRPDVGLVLPAVVIHSGIKLACEAQENLRDSVRTNCQVALGSMNKCTPIWGPAAEKSVFKSELNPYTIFKLAYLHVSLLQRRKYGEGAFSCPYQWLQADLLAGLQALRHTSRACNSSLSLAAVEVMLGHVTYGGHVTNGLDLNAVKSMARWDATVQSRPDQTKDVLEYKYLDIYIDSLPDTISCQELGLTEASSSTYQGKLSSAVVDCLALCTGLQPPLLSMDNEVKLIAKKTVNQISTIIESVKSHDLAHEAPTSVTSFIQRELAFFKTLLEEAMQSLELLIKACCGLIAFTPGLFKLALSLGHRWTPLKWLSNPGTDVSLAAWMVNISKQVKKLGEYLLSSPVHPPSFCLGAFAHPHAFLACVLMDHARSAMKSVYALEFSVELLQPDTLPTSPPSRGVYLSNLKLNGASWDTGRNCISELLANGSCDLPIIWLKPVEVIRSRAPSAKMERQGNDIPLFDCPLLTGQDWGTDFSTLVTSLPLPSVVPGEILKQRRVSIVSML